MKIGIYPGSFDPFTVGHLDVLSRASALLDKVYAAVLLNSEKHPFFSVQERLEFIQSAASEAGLNNVEAISFDGLLVDYAKSIKAQFVIRGLRAVSDFEYELKIDAMNKRLAPNIDTLYFMANVKHSFLSSTMIKEVAAFGGDISGLVPGAYEKLIAERLTKR